MTEEQQYELECAACPGEGACGGMFTANTMACASEALGIALPYSASIPAVAPERTEASRWAGSSVLKLIERRHQAARHPDARGVRERHRRRRRRRRLDQRRAAPARDRRTSAACELPLDDFDAIARRVPHIADLQARRPLRADGLPPRRRRPARHEDAARRRSDPRRRMTVTGKTVAENLDGLAVPGRGRSHQAARPPAGADRHDGHPARATSRRRAA